jgi:hypothetical protein
MGMSPSGSHLGGDPNGLHDLLGGGAMLQGRLRMPADAIRTLGHMRTAINCFVFAETAPAANTL